MRGSALLIHQLFDTIYPTPRFSKQDSIPSLPQWPLLHPSPRLPSSPQPPPSSPTINQVNNPVFDTGTNDDPRINFCPWIPHPPYDEHVLFEGHTSPSHPSLFVAGNGFRLCPALLLTKRFVEELEKFITTHRESGTLSSQAYLESVKEAARLDEELNDVRGKMAVMKVFGVSTMGPSGPLDEFTAGEENWKKIRKYELMLQNLTFEENLVKKERMLEKVIALLEPELRRVGVDVPEQGMESVPEAPIDTRRCGKKDDSPIFITVTESFLDQRLKQMVEPDYWGKGWRCRASGCGKRFGSRRSARQHLFIKH
ncbi:hypothetical protein M011DRAFT_479526 [Sporormia fimetaria CBS 119925]|uniref:C2H2-type domain-containing protein n=1 Tax=Sporormia fimetaria CBS 119925 TaxID=1340428 RepID=A0A6A6V4F0_9PLEO|nr:hypothetical protein M011DRAFT_479526 [Sporormia fimetaria CBS 119925]